MNLNCIQCSQPFTLENVNVARPDITCPNPLCGKVTTLDMLMEHRYGLEVGIRVRIILGIVDGKRGPVKPGYLAFLNNRVEEFARLFEAAEREETDKLQKARAA